MLKTRRLGYDGKGQHVVRSDVALSAAWAELGQVPCIYEALVPFEREVSLVATRGSTGAFVAYPLCRNEHVDGILRVTTAPDPDSSPALAAAAERHVRTIAERLGHVGTLAVEFFVVAGELIANEMAPRVHNSGHWTIEGAETSQFENHLRAVLGWPLGAAQARGHSAMLNLLGRLPPREAVLTIPGAHLHDYGKSPRHKRKVGHCTLVDSDRTRLLKRLEPLQAVVSRSNQ
jgi:5-(carboxyamino)imidazole ribonucleotide synthase